MYFNGVDSLRRKSIYFLNLIKFFILIKAGCLLSYLTRLNLIELTKNQRRMFFNGVGPLKRKSIYFEIKLNFTF